MKKEINNTIKKQKKVLKEREKNKEVNWKCVGRDRLLNSVLDKVGRRRREGF
jgi:hypothetical protein